MKKLIIAIVLMLISCKEKSETIISEETDKHTYYTVEFMWKKFQKEQDQKINDLKKDSTHPLSPAFPIIYQDQYYSNHNFIIDSLNQIYYYYHKEAYLPLFCGTGLERGPFSAKYIELHPKKVIRIAKTKFDYFLKNNIIDSLEPNELTTIMIGSQKDSFYSPETSKVFTKVGSFYNNNERLFSVLLRRTTEEENVVLQHKKSGKEYDYRKIEWDSTKTRFPKN